MQNIPLSCRALHVLLLGGASLAIAGVAAQGQTLPVLAVNRELGLSFSTSWLYYRESGTSGLTLDSEHGWTPGFSVKGSVIGDIASIDNVFASITYRFNTGYSHHSSRPLSGNGSNIDYPAGSTKNDIVGEVGKGFLATPDLLLTPVAQLEYREWLRTLPKAGLAIQEDYTFFAPGGGLRASYAVSPELVLNGKLGLEYEVSPSLATVGNGNEHVPSLNFNLGAGPVFQAGLGADYALYSPLHLYLDAAYTRFGFGQSATAHFGTSGTELEPSSQTDEISIDLGVALAF